MGRWADDDGARRPSTTPAADVDRLIADERDAIVRVLKRDVPDDELWTPDELRPSERDRVCYGALMGDTTRQAAAQAWAQARHRALAAERANRDREDQ